MLVLGSETRLVVHGSVDEAAFLYVNEANVVQNLEWLLLMMVVPSDECWIALLMKLMKFWELPVQRMKVARQQSVPEQTVWYQRSYNV